jgi:uracil-DNA glycosylase
VNSSDTAVKCEKRYQHPELPPCLGVRELSIEGEAVGDINTIRDDIAQNMKVLEMGGFVPGIAEGYAPLQEARLLIIGQDPGHSGAERSGVLSFDNKDPSADRLVEIFKEIDLDWGITYPWNTVPWTQMGTKAHDLPLVRQWEIIPTLLGEMKGLKVVVLMGRAYAWELKTDIEDYNNAHKKKIKVLTTPHPGRRGLKPKWGLAHQELVDWLRSDLKRAKEIALA